MSNAAEVAPPPQPQNTPRQSGFVSFIDGDLRSRLRLITGLILFAFVLTHYGGHALGNISLEWMQASQELREVMWQTLPGTVLLYGSLILHAALAIAKTVARKSFRMPAAEWVQLVLGLSIPLLLAEHIYFTRVGEAVFGLEDDYDYFLALAYPGAFWQQTLLLGMVWVHAMVGLYFWLRHRPWFRRAAAWLFAFAVAMPILATTGWTTVARELILMPEADLVEFNYEALGRLDAWADISQAVALATLSLSFAIPLGLGVVRRLRNPLTVTYHGEKKVRTAPGPTLLEISRANGVPHTSICGGRARCSTCRVKIIEGQDGLQAPSEQEQVVLNNIKAGPDVRLACQLKPAQDISVIRLVRPRNAAPEAVTSDAYRWGVEQPVVVMFTDLRGFTTFSEKRLPYDVVFVLNAYLEQSAQTIADHLGVVDKFMGDGIMALFGVGRTFEQGARDALNAAVALQDGLDALNEELEQHLDTPLRLVIALHGGPAILGRIGQSNGDGPLTALGDTVNTASRLEAIVKAKNGRIVTSSDVLEAAGISGEGLGEEDEVAIRGREEAQGVVVIHEHDALRNRL